MKKIAACLAAAAVALFWAADGRAQNLPDDAISGESPYLRIPLSGHRTNPCTRLSIGLPLNDFDLSGHRPKSFLRISVEVAYPDSRTIVGFRPNSFTKLRGALPERTNTDEIARFGINRGQLTISGERPPSFLKISSQYPTSSGN